MNIAAILANGTGSRFNSNVPKQFHKINGKMIIEYVIESCYSCESIDKIIIATNVESNLAYLSEICSKYNIDLIEGGSSRNRTFKNVLDYVNDNYDCNKIIICDAVRPLVTADLFELYNNYLDTYDAVVTAQKITDSLGCYNQKQIVRDNYYLMQSPEAFNFQMIYKYFDSESTLTEATHQLPDTAKIKLYFEFTNNFKLTYPSDLLYMNAILNCKDINVNVDAMLFGVKRLNSFLINNYPKEVKEWEEKLKEEIPDLMERWKITNYKVVKTSHFGIIFVANSLIYGECAIKIIPPFIGRYNQEKTCYQTISTSFMCELLDYDDVCSTLLLKKCNDTVNAVFNPNNTIVHDFFAQVIDSDLKNTCQHLEWYHDYASELEHKKFENYEYKNELVMRYVNKSIDLYHEYFNENDYVLTHGDIHRFNMMEKNDILLAIDPIGYIAPVEIELARYIGTELNEIKGDRKELLDSLFNYFSDIVDIDRLKIITFIDMTFRMHNSLFENETYELTDKWLEDLEAMNIL